MKFKIWDVIIICRLLFTQLFSDFDCRFPMLSPVYDTCRLQYTADFLTNIIFLIFHYRELHAHVTVNRLTWTLFRLTGALPRPNKVLFRPNKVLCGLTKVLCSLMGELYTQANWSTVWPVTQWHIDSWLFINSVD